MSVLPSKTGDTSPIYSEEVRYDLECCLEHALVKNEFTCGRKVISIYQNGDEIIGLFQRKSLFTSENDEKRRILSCKFNTNFLETGNSPKVDYFLPPFLSKVNTNEEYGKILGAAGDSYLLFNENSTHWVGTQLSENVKGPFYVENNQIYEIVDGKVFKKDPCQTLGENTRLACLNCWRRGREICVFSDGQCKFASTNKTSLNSDFMCDQIPMECRHKTVRHRQKNISRCFLNSILIPKLFTKNISFNRYTTGVALGRHFAPRNFEAL